MSEKNNDVQHGSAAVEQPSAGDVSLARLLRSMRISEWAAVITTAGVLLGGAAFVGGFIEWLGRSDAIARAKEPLETRISDLEQQKSDLEELKLQSVAHVASLEQANRALENQVNILRRGVEIEASFATFAEHYINYLAGAGPLAADLLADYVCALYREDQTDGSDIDFTPATAEELVRGDWAFSLEALEKSGHNAELLRELRELHERGVARFLPSVSKEIGAQVAPTTTSG